MTNLLDDLNPQQRTAVEHTEGPVLVLAGAGSGKTRVITYRIAYLVHSRSVRPESILAVTFTNKAADQMKERVAALLQRSRWDGQDDRGRQEVGWPADDSDQTASRDNQPVTGYPQPASDEPLLASDFLEIPRATAPVRGSNRGPHISTFHSFCVYLLRQDIEALGYPRTFSIYDEDDQMRLIKASIKELGLSEQIPSPRGAVSQISYAKNHGVSPEELYRQAREEETAKVAILYDLYVRKLRQANALDFDDLLLKAVELFQEAPKVCEKYNRRFKYILIDEYQDTNIIQYQLIRSLTLLQQNLCVVGDEDQSIYRWRGADIGNILRFEEDYPQTKVIRLEQNYRSVQMILDAASAVVSHNLARKGKTLWTKRGQGQRIGLFEASDADEEAWFVVAQIASQLAASPNAGIAVLYRTNAQSRVMEEALRRREIKYRMVGGFTFYGRAEIKDALAYARLAGNLNDSASFVRILNSPARGIGDTTLAELEETARHLKLSHWEALERELSEKRLPPRALKALESFYSLLQQLVEDHKRLGVREFFKNILERTGYVTALEAEGTPEAESRIENLHELVNAAEAAEQAGETLVEFLDHAALASDTDSYDPRARVTLMTLHSAKGLEFSTVFLVGLEEKLFPHKFSAIDEDAIEEERRLCYVGMTRAKDRLVLTWARQRRSFAGDYSSEQKPSRFLREVPAALIERLNVASAGKPRTSWENALTSAEDVDRFITKRSHTGKKSRPAPALAFSTPRRQQRRWKLGTMVRHPKYGLGTVLECDGDDENAKVTVSFPGYGKKKLIERYASLEEA